MELSSEATRLQQKMARASTLMVKRMHTAQTRFDYYVEMVCRDNLGNAIKLAEIHRAWIRHVEYCWARGLRALILAPFGHGKCAPVRQTLQLADGSVTTHGAIIGLTVPVVAYASDGQYVRAYAKGFDNGNRRVWRFTFDSGRTLEVTDEHPLLTLSGWLEAKNVEIGRYAAAANNVASLGTQRMEHGEAMLLGILVADGSLTCNQMTVTKYDPQVRRAVCSAAEALGFHAEEIPIKTKAKANPEAKLVALSQGDDRLGLGGPRVWARSHGLAGCGSYEKRTPPAIFIAPDEQIAQYLGAYFSCDGSIDDTGRTGVELYSVNRGLLDDAQSLLSRLGIASRVRPKKGRYNGEVHHSWRLTVAWSFVPRFAECIPLLGPKASRLASLYEKMKKKSRNGNGDIIPIEYRQFLKQTPHWHKHNSGVGLDQSKAGGGLPNGTERVVVRRAAQDERNAYLLRMTAPELVWDRIVSKEDLGMMPTVGVDVDEHHTYLAGGMIVHNTSSLTVPLCSWLMGRDITTRIKIITNDDASASERLMACKRTIESNSFRQVFPTVRRGDRWNNHELFLKRSGYSTIDPTLHARGIWTTGVGSRADYMFFDDAVDQKNSTDVAQRKKVLNFIEGTWLNRLEPTGHVLGIGTAWHQGDANHILMQRAGWCTLIHRVSADCTQIDQEVLGARDGQYPMPIAA